MTPRLRAEQRKAIDALVAGHRLEAVPTDDTRADSFLTLAADTLVDVAHVRLPQNRYNLAYDRHFDRMRRARNQMHYEARPVSSADADKAERTARAVLTAATMPKDKP